MACFGHSRVRESEPASDGRQRNQPRLRVWELCAALTLAAVALATGAVALWESPPAHTGAAETTEVERQSVSPRQSKWNSSSPQGPVATASSWSMAPAYGSALSQPGFAPAAAALALEAQEGYGIRILLEGQDWGPDEDSQLRNIGTVMSALRRLPDSVTAWIAAQQDRRLLVLSNAGGRTEGGWQPYGDAAPYFYTNLDLGPAGLRPANQVVLAPGADVTTVLHELLHAYQFRDVRPGDYVLALLGQEMRSFMAATGWRQLVSDSELLAAAREPWQTVNGLFAYEGRPLEYTDASGVVSVNPDNPLEAFAIVGAVFYGQGAGTPLPGWPQYWDWFREHLGAPPHLSSVVQGT